MEYRGRMIDFSIAELLDDSFCPLLLERHLPADVHRQSINACSLHTSQLFRSLADLKFLEAPIRPRNCIPIILEYIAL
jgi:hypothetical protein